MDKAKANILAQKLAGRDLDGWLITSFVNNGKSAAVFKAVKGDKIAAIKVYDDDLVKKFGDHAQLERLNREKSLQGHSHPNLVAIHESGYIEDVQAHYITMEYLDNDDLSQTLDKIPEENIPILVEQLASAARFLEENGFVHRDIKPANIVVVDNYTRLILLDFGVLKPVGESDLTDGGSAPLFVGTNQYASPEFAMRNEEDTPDSWRAVTFYQIGAVIHDMVMKKPLFADSITVPARLAYAVQTEVPVVESATLPPYLVKLARLSLVKSPTARLALLDWDSYNRVEKSGDDVTDLKDRIRGRIAASSVQALEVAAQNKAHGPPPALEYEAEELTKEALSEAGGTELGLPRRVVYRQLVPTPCVVAAFEPSAEHSLPHGLTVALRIQVVDSLSGIFVLYGDARAAPPGTDWTPEMSLQIYAGALDAAVVRDAILEYLFKSVEAAQTAASQPLTIEGANGSDVVD